MLPYKSIGRKRKHVGALLSIIAGARRFIHGQRFKEKTDRPIRFAEDEPVENDDLSRFPTSRNGVVYGLSI